MRVTPHHLVGDRARHVGEVEPAQLLGHAGVEHDLQQQIAQLLAERRRVAGLGGLGDLVGFLDRVGRDGGEALPDVPRASARPDPAAAP